MSGSYFDQLYGCFIENQYLLEAATKPDIATMLDVGCATAPAYRYLKRNGLNGKVKYLGLDLSGPAVTRAQSIHPEARFEVTAGDPLVSKFPERFDLVYSRDTVLHQESPYTFLDDLLAVTGKVLILRLRTRDTGETCFDVESSCQFHYEQFWMPYIVLNIDELLDNLKGNERVRKIRFNRSYEVLGGNNQRFLPKNLYESATGGAETSLMIELGEPVADDFCEVIVDNVLEGHNWLRGHKWRLRFLSLRDRLLRPFTGK